MKRRSILFFQMLLYCLSMISCDNEISKGRLESTWGILSYNEQNFYYPNFRCFIQFHKGKYNVFWFFGNRGYYCPSRDGTYNHFDEILFLREDYVSYEMDYNDPDLYIGLLSKADSSKVRFKSLRARYFRSDPIFNPDSLTVRINGYTYFVTPVTEDIFK